MIKLKASDFLKLTIDEVFTDLPNGLDDIVDLELDTGECVPVKVRFLRSLWYYWEYNRQYNIPVHASQVPAPDVWLTNDEHLRQQTVALNLVLDAYPDERPLHVAKLSGRITTRLVNELPVKLAEYQATIHINDYIDIIEDEEVAAAKRYAQETIPKLRGAADRYAIIQDTNNTMERRFHEEGQGKFKTNGLSLLVNSETLSIKQLKQAVGLRGYTTEVNSAFFPEPVVRGFIEGLEGREIAQESRSGTKATFYTEEPVQTTEYSNRIGQILTAIVQRVHVGDCGSTVTYPTQIGKKDLRKFEGKYYYRDGSDKLELIHENDTHLIGKVIHLRNPAGCLIRDRVGICSVCFGELYKSLPEGTLAAHPFGVELFGGISQRVISVKHDDTSSVGKVRDLSLDDKQFIQHSDRTDILITARHLKGIELIISQKEAEYLMDIAHLKDLEMLAPSKVTQLTAVAFHYKDKEDLSQYHQLDLSSGRTTSALSTAMLAYLKRNPDAWYLNSNGKNPVYVIDLSGLPPKTPLFQLPFKHHSMLDVHAEIEQFITSKSVSVGPNKERRAKLDDFTSFGQAVEFFDEMISANGFNINRAAIEISLYIYTVQDPDNGNYDLAKGSNTVKFCTEADLFVNRSLSMILVYEGQRGIFSNPKSYLLRNRAPHPYDSLFLNRGPIDVNRLLKPFQ